MVIQDSIEIVLVAKSFFKTDIDKVHNFPNDAITLIKYCWFENELLVIEYLNNEPTNYVDISKGNRKQSAYINSKNAIPQLQISNAVDDKNTLASGRNVFILQSKNLNAKGYETGNKKDFIVLAGSEISTTVTANISDGEKKLKSLYLSDGTIKDGKFTKDVIFTSKSQAAKVLLGYSVSGNLVWK